IEAPRSTSPCGLRAGHPVRPTPVCEDKEQAMPIEPTQGEAETAQDVTTQSNWAALREAIRGTNADYTKIPLRRAVFLLAVPMVLELVLESTFAIVDIFFVAKLGPSAVATVGLT